MKFNPGLRRDFLLPDWSLVFDFGLLGNVIAVAINRNIRPGSLFRNINPVTYVMVRQPSMHRSFAGDERLKGFLPGRAVTYNSLIRFGDNRFRKRFLQSPTNGK